MQEAAIQPEFLSLTAEDLKSHLCEITTAEAKDHKTILERLLGEIGTVDFEQMAFPEIEEKRKKINELFKKASNPDGSQNTTDEGLAAASEMKRLTKEVEAMRLTSRHFIIICIDEILRIAEHNRWGICRSNDMYYLYNGQYWSATIKDDIQSFLGKAAEKMGVKKFDARFFEFREKLFKQFHSESFLPQPESDPGKVLINLQNGTFHIEKSGKTELKNFDRSDALKYQLPFKYDPSAEAVLWQQFLNRVLPDPDAQKVLAEYLGFIFIKHGSKTIKEEKALILYGSGANGKSVVFDVITAMFGRENVTNYSLQSLTEEKGFYRSQIANKLINYASEINGKMDTSKFKAMVSGEPVEACQKYGQPFTMTEYAKFIFNCNELPRDVEHTNAFFRRFLILPFNVTIPTEEQDKELSYKIIEKELSGVFNWVLAGLDRLLKQGGFTKCDAVEKAVEAYKVESDSVQMFLTENEYTPDASKEVRLSDFYHEYKIYCLDNGFSPGSSRTFSTRLKVAGFQSVRRNYGNVVFAKNTGNGKI